MTTPDTRQNTAEPPVLPPPMPGGAGAQTLDRGLRVLAIVSASRRPMTVRQIVAASGLHRSICYRIIRTLTHHDLLERDENGRYHPGGGLAVLAGRIEPQLQSVARPHLEQLAEVTGMTAFTVVAHGDQAVTVLVVEPRTSLAHVSYRPGGRHSLTLGAPGLAILAGRRPAPGERPEVTLARDRGWATSSSEVISGYHSVAAPVLAADGSCRYAVAIVFAGSGEEDQLAAEVTRAAEGIAVRLG